MATNETKFVSSNKLAVIHVLAALIKNPLLFADNNYDFSIDDFPEQFHRILFGAVEHLAKNGMETIGYIDIDQFLKQYTVQYQVFTANKGVEYIQNILAIYDPKKFDYYYHTLKKYSVINKLNEAGVDTTDIYDPNIIDPEQSAKMHANFDNLTVNDILLKEETKLILIKEKFGTNSDRVENHAGDGLRALKERLKEVPDIGLPLISPKLTTIYRGQRRGCLFMESAPTGMGKALPNSSKIPTPNGWKTIGDIKVGDYLFDANGHPTKVLAVFPQGEKQVYEITFFDGRKVRCCEDHLWTYTTKLPENGEVLPRNCKTKTLKEIIEQEQHDEFLHFLNDEGKCYLFIPQQKAVEYPKQKHSLSPYKYGKQLETCIPTEYLEDCIKNREKLIKGMIRNNKHLVFKEKDGELRLKTSHEQLAKDFITLARSLGYQTERTIDFSWDIKGIYKVKCKKAKAVAMGGVKKLDYSEEMTCFLVDNQEHLFLTDDFVVTHNSRVANGEACHLAVPEYYDPEQKKWITTNLQESVLVISTELEEYECQQMWLANIAGVPEMSIKDGRYMTDEEERVDHAIELLEKSNLYFVSITNFDIDDIVNTIKKYKQLHDVNYVYFDYLGESLKLTAGAARQTRVQGLRTDQVLLMFASALKDLAKTLNIYIWTSTQLSGDYKNAKELDAGYLRSAKSIADKVDVGSILMPIREQDKPAIQDYLAKGFELKPTAVMYVYKVRAGSFQNIKVYVHFNRDICRRYDCFVVDNEGKMIQVNDTNIELMLDQTSEKEFEVAFMGGATKKSSDFDFDF